MVNICIPNYNKGELVHHALGSLLRQTTPDWRAVVVDDASTDGSWEIIQGYAARDSRITAVRNETNRGGNYSRNLAAKLGGDAKYLIFLDSDDWLEDDCVENRVREFENGQHEEDDFLVFHLRTVYVREGKECVSRDSWYKAERDLDLSMLNHTYGWQTMTLIWRRTSFERLGGFDESLPRLQDVEFHARAVLEHSKFSYAERQTADCRFFAGSARRTTSCAKGLRNFIDAAELFVAKMRTLIDAKGERLALRHAALSTMLLVVVRQVGDAYQAGEISRGERDQLIAHIQAQPHLGGGQLLSTLASTLLASTELRDSTSHSPVSRALSGRLDCFSLVRPLASKAKSPAHPIVVVQYKPLPALPPVMNQLLALKAIGRDVHFIGVETERGKKFLEENRIPYIFLPYDVNLYQNNTIVTKVTHRLSRARRFFPCRAALNSAVRSIENKLGCKPTLWFMDTQSAALMGNSVQDYMPQVLVSIFEMQEARGRYWAGFDFDAFMKRATVVVPEYNRAHILKEHYRLTRLPCIVPNTSFNHPRKAILPLSSEAQDVFDRVGDRPVFLYQGGWTEDRRDVGLVLETIARNRPQYCVIMMPENEAVRKMLAPYPNAFSLPHPPPPSHLAVTAHASVGIAVYNASGRSYLERLNAVYCAPNKIYDYAGFGIPTLGNDIPGLKYTVEAAGAGICTSLDEQSILRAADQLIENLETYKKNANKFYDASRLEDKVVNALSVAEGN